MNSLHYAVVVGINRYPALVDLAGAVGDASRFVDWLVDPNGGGVPRPNIEVVPASQDQESDLSSEAAQPAVYQIDSALARVNKRVGDAVASTQAQWEETRLYIFVAGHGIAPLGGDGALLAANATMDELGHNLELSLYRRWYQLCCPFHELVVFADCCRSSRKGAPSNGPPFTVHGTAERPVRFTIGYGAEFGRPAHEGPDLDDPNLRRGYFTDALLRGLREAGDDRFGGRVSSSSLPGFVQAYMANLDAVHGRQQNIEFGGVQDMIFGPPLPLEPPIHHVSILLPAAVVGPVELLDGQLQVLDTWDAGAGPHSTKLPNGYYQVVREGHRETSDSTGLGTFHVAGADREVPL